MTNRSAAEQIIRILRQGDHEAYFVGGCVRDMLLGKRRIKDHDVATSARPEQVRSLFRRSRQVGAKFGVVLVGLARQWIEVASFRTDQGYSDGRHPDKIRFATIEEDAQRRDFTINGMYADPFDERIIDLVGGRKDLEARTVRAIGDPEQRFLEDHLRMLRAVRFAAQLGFDIEPATARAITAHAEYIQQISAERILEELRKLLTRPGRGRGIRLAADLGLLSHVLPELTELRRCRGISFAQHAGGDSQTIDAFEQTVRTLDQLGRAPRFEVAAAALLSLTGLARADTLTCEGPMRRRVRAEHANASAQLAQEICRRFTCSNRERLDIVWLVQFLPVFGSPSGLDRSELKRMMIYRRYDDLHRLYRARVRAGLEPRETLDAIDRMAGEIQSAGFYAEPLINGTDLAERLGLPPGPDYQRILDDVFDAQLKDEIRTADQALERARKIAHELGLID